MVQKALETGTGKGLKTIQEDVIGRLEQNSKSQAKPVPPIRPVLKEKNLTGGETDWADEKILVLVVNKMLHSVEKHLGRFV